MATIVLMTFAVSCNKKYDPEIQLPRQFKPGTVTVQSGETQATITWGASLFSATNTTYTVEVSQDTTFPQGSVVFRKTVDTAAVVVTDDSIGIRKDYYARIKANANGSTAASGWVLSPIIRLSGEQVFMSLSASDIIDNGVLLKWRTTPGLVRIVITPEGGTPFTVNLTPTDLTAERRIITGLTANTNYSAEIFDATKSKGYLTFRTAAPLSGNLIDLRGITGRPSVLADTLPLIADGSTVILKRGETYTISATLNLSKAVKIISGPDLADPNRAIISMPANFNIVAGSTIGYIDFQDIALIGTDYTSKYVFNINAASTISRISFEGCRMEIFRGVVRLQTAAINLGEFRVNNCIIDSIANYGVINADVASCKVDNISIRNSTIYKTEKVVTSSKPTAGSISVVIDNCTFNEAPIGNSTSSYIVDYGSFNVANGISITNCILGKGKPNGTNIEVRDVRAGTGTTISSANNYVTSDHTVVVPVPPAVSTALSPVISYSGTSFTLWQDPLNGNFRFADNTFPGRNSSGDPRWR